MSRDERGADRSRRRRCARVNRCATTARGGSAGWRRGRRLRRAGWSARWGWWWRWDRSVIESFVCLGIYWSVDYRTGRGRNVFRKSQQGSLGAAHYSQGYSNRSDCWLVCGCISPAEPDKHAIYLAWYSGIIWPSESSSRLLRADQDCCRRSQRRLTSMEYTNIDLTRRVNERRPELAD